MDPLTVPIRAGSTPRIDLGRSVLTSGARGATGRTTRRSHGAPHEGGATATAPVHTAPHENGLGTAGLALGIVAAVVRPVPVLGLMGAPLAIIALGLPIPGLLRTTGGRATNKGSAIAGLVPPILAPLACLLWLVVGVVASDSTPLGDAALDGPLPLDIDLKPGGTIDGWALFEIPAKSKVSSVVLDDGE
ncbi:hypothetical protein [Mobilicoccus pelagius]|uniref:DUF4190 domain-containing protein n=1 Tax=Mobilicoccus pelagius NBRC 104925 TaxID=1089455 RepID=H5UQV6_9MICO|nr:hypothetical protein [Mobilicoccus pelagius]GAB48114.1 hypothetical protein MOPEL_060_00310 [Mobilicoccus pelagius NBRC 104925]